MGTRQQRELSFAALEERADGKYQLLQGKQGEDNEESRIGKRGETEVSVTYIHKLVSRIYPAPAGA